MSYFVTKELVDRAVELVRPTITAILGSELVGKERVNLAIMVIEPSHYHYPYVIAHDPKETWPHEYDEIARSKADTCHNYGKPSGHIIHRTPWLLDEGDARYTGGIYEDGIAIGVSGLPSHFDEMVAWMIFNAIAGLSMDAMDKFMKDPNSPDILPVTEEPPNTEEHASDDADSNDAAAAS